MLSKKVRSINSYTAGEQINDPDVIKLNSNENPYLPPVEVTAVDCSELALNKYPDPTARRLREELGVMHGVDKDNIFVGNGSDEVLGFCYSAFFDEGADIVIPEITYSFYPVWAELYGMQIRKIPLKEGLVIDPSDYVGLNQAVAAGGKGRRCTGIIIANPNAPTTLALGRGDIERIVVGNPDIAVIVDEAYVDFGAQSADTLIKKYANVVVVRTFSKSWSLAGVRCGYAVASKEAVSALNIIRDCFNSYSVDSVAQAVALNAVINRAYMSQNCAKVIKTRERVTEVLRGRGYEVLDSKTNFLFVAREGWNPKSIYLKLKERKILVRYFDKPLINQYLRITVGTDAQMDALLSRLAEVDCLA